MLGFGTPRQVVAKIDGEDWTRPARRSFESCRSSRGSLDLSRLTRTSSSGLRLHGNNNGSQSARDSATPSHTRRMSTSGMHSARENRPLYRKASCEGAGGSQLRVSRKANLNNAMGLPWSSLDWMSPANINKIKDKREKRGGTRFENPSTTTTSSSRVTTTAKEQGFPGVVEENPEVSGAAPSNFSVFRRYHLNEEIGRGTYGIVYSASEVVSGRRVAIKKIPSVSKSRSRCSNTLNKAKQEADIMRALQDCTSAVQFRGYFDKDESPMQDASYIVMERCSGGDLASFVKKYGPATEQHAAFVASEVLNLLKHCHDSRILHGDVKAGNFVITSEIHEQMFLHRPTLLRSGWLKGVDFGTCQYFGTGQLSSRVGTPTHWAPEVFGACYNTQADMWSLGVLIYHLMSGRLPYCDQEKERSLKTEREMLRLVMTKAPDFSYGPWLECSPQARDFIMGLLMKDSQARMTASEALQHPWIRMHLDWQATDQNCFRGLGGELDTWIPCFT